MCTMCILFNEISTLSFISFLLGLFIYHITNHALKVYHPRSEISSNFVMSIIKAEPVDPYLSVAIATGRPKLEILVDYETVVKTEPDSVYYNGPVVKEVSSVKEECSLTDEPVCFLLHSNE